VARMVLLIDRDIQTGHALAALLRRGGDVVHVARGRAQAHAALRRLRFDLAVVDLFAEGGGVELARDLAREIPQVVLSLGTVLSEEEVIEAALGFPVHRKAALPALLTTRGASSTDEASEGRHGGSRRRGHAASEPAPTPFAHAPHRSRRSH
jgi:CheY-like chemotaxis protein